MRGWYEVLGEEVQAGDLAIVGRGWHGGVLLAGTHDPSTSGTALQNGVPCGAHVAKRANWGRERLPPKSGARSSKFPGVLPVNAWQYGQQMPREILSLRPLVEPPVISLASRTHTNTQTNTQTNLVP